MARPYAAASIRRVLLLACALVILPSSGAPLAERAGTIARVMATQLPLKETNQITLTDISATGERLTMRHAVSAALKDTPDAAFREGMASSMCRDMNGLTIFAADGGSVEHVYVFTDRKVSFVLTAANCHPVVKPLTRADLQVLAGSVKFPMKITEEVSVVAILVGEGMELVYVLSDSSMSPEEAKNITAAAKARVASLDVASQCGNPNSRPMILGGATIVVRRKAGEIAFSEARADRKACGLR